MVYEDLAKPGVQQVGKALSTILGLGNTVLLPVKLLNDKLQMRYAQYLESYRQQLAAIPEEKIIEVAPEIGVPIMENLEKTSNKTVAELYISLLTSASNIDLVANTHPRFVSIIENLTSDEVLILNKLNPYAKIYYITSNMIIDVFKTDSDPVAISRLLQSYPQGIAMINRFTRATTLEKTQVLALPDKAKFYFENLQGQGLIHSEETMQIQPKEQDELKQVFAEKLKLPQPQFTRLEFQYGWFELTTFGKLFMKACTEDNIR